jgi:phosphoglycolate phosphatase
MTMRIELVIFDCDGVLFRSERANIAFYNEVLRLAGEPPLDDWGLAACHALSSAQLFERYFGDRPEQLARLRRIAQEIDYAPFYPMMEPYENLREVLGNVRRSYRTAMATNRGKTTRGVLDYFELWPFFELAVGVADVARPKPHPDMLIKCLEHFALGPEQAVYVGDQISDAEAARAAGLRFVAIGSVDANCDARIEAINDLEPALARL